MLVGILSDIHSNYYALKSVLNKAKKIGIDKLIIAGDYFGYYYNPDLVFSLLQSWDWIGIKGNHEIILENLIKKRKFKEAKKKYGSSYEITAKKLQKNEILKILKLPSTKSFIIDKIRIFLCHGSPKNIDKYIYKNSPIKDKKLLDVKNHDLVIYGHTHYPAKWNYSKRIILNPGSVGQPRDNKPGASWILLDTRKKKIVFRRENYNVKKIKKECKKHDPHLPFLASYF